MSWLVFLGVLWRAKHLLFYDFIRHSTRHTKRVFFFARGGDSALAGWSNLTCGKRTSLDEMVRVHSEKQKKKESWLAEYIDKFIL